MNEKELKINRTEPKTVHKYVKNDQHSQKSSYSISIKNLLNQMNGGAVFIFIFYFSIILAKRYSVEETMEFTIVCRYKNSVGVEKKRHQRKGEKNRMKLYVVMIEKYVVDY